MVIVATAIDIKNLTVSSSHYFLTSFSSITSSLGKQTSVLSEGIERANI